MNISEGVSCEICLRADEAESMLDVPIPHALHNPARIATICPDCIGAIAARAKAAAEDMTAEDADHGA